MKPVFPILALTSAGLFPTALATAEPSLPDEVKWRAGPVNAIEILAGEKRVAINRALSPGPDLLLLTHARRDVVRAARESKPKLHWASIRSRGLLEEAETHWSDWWTGRFDYYGQQVRRRPVRNWPAQRYFEVSDEAAARSTVEWGGLEIEILDTPGYTRDGISYLCEVGGEQIAFVGDLLLAGGQVVDLYSFQDEIRPARIGAYHGYLGRISRWIESLEKLRETRPSLLVSSRGPVSKTPLEDIDAAISKAKKIYRNYLDTNALHWYFGEERMGTCAELVLGESAATAPMPFAEHIDLPDWCRHIGTTKLLVSASGNAFALDVGGRRSLDTLVEFEEQGLIRELDGIFATHTHNDHTAAIADASVHFGCPVLAVEQVAEVLSDPGAWFLPGIAPHRVESVTTLPHGHSWTWEEFTLTAYFFPGQMYRHGALLVEKPDDTPVLFIGDSFSPSGIDDYCMMNRNLMREDTGYLHCLGFVRDFPEETWLVNQHIPHLFRFRQDELDFLESRYRERIGQIASFTPWDDPNFAIDEQWARFVPYAQTATANGRIETAIRIENHSQVERSYQVALRDGEAVLASARIRIPARSTGEVPFEIPFPDNRSEFLVWTADIERDDGIRVNGFCETILRTTAGE